MSQLTDSSICIIAKSGSQGFGSFMIVWTHFLYYSLTLNKTVLINYHESPYTCCSKEISPCVNNGFNLIFKDSQYYQYRLPKDSK